MCVCERRDSWGGTIQEKGANPNVGTVSNLVNASGGEKTEQPPHGKQMILNKLFRRWLKSKIMNYGRYCIPNMRIERYIFNILSNRIILNGYVTPRENKVTGIISMLIKY